LILVIAAVAGSVGGSPASIAEAASPGKFEDTTCSVRDPRRRAGRGGGTLGSA